MLQKKELEILYNIFIFLPEDIIKLIYDYKLKFQMIDNYNKLGLRLIK